MQVLGDLLQEIYPNDFERMVTALADLPQNGTHVSQKEWDWYKRSVLYLAYPDSFKVNGVANLYTLADQVPRIAGLGCNVLHVLPFLDSPMIDAGFDIKNYYQIREDVGGEGGLNTLLDRCREHRMRMFVDLVLNHTAMNHDWYQKAVAGDEYFRNFYIHVVNKPELIERYTDQLGVWAKYLVEGKEVSMRILFPEQAGELPHFEQGSDGYWYYHTFYPHQIDLNWHNPEVFLEFGKIMSYWSVKGMSFRLDAIPFVGKDINNGEVEQNPKTHKILCALNRLMKTLSPAGAFLVEAYQPVPVTKRFFGLYGSQESEIAYAFQLVHGLWVALINGNSEHIWQMLEQLRDVPEWAQWAIFLRNHDQLSFEYADEEQRLVLAEALGDKGLSFMEGFGISGRTASFLDGDERRILLGHILLASLPGMPALYYGDELGKQNDVDYMEEKTRQKLKLNTTGDLSHDTRDINRGPIKEEELNSGTAQIIQPELARLFAIRRQYPDLAVLMPTRLEGLPEGVFGARYEFDGPDLSIFINLVDEDREVALETGFQAVYQMGEARVEDGKLFLPRYSAIWLAQ
jgi:maltose alpha-D-glucosyltransferase / alpha-amylase